MAAQRMSQEERSQWRRLIALARQLDQLAPWGWMSVADCFGVRLPGLEEPCFVVFGGEPKSFRNVRLLLGWKAFYDLVTRLADPAKQVSAWLLEIRMLEVLFVSENLLFEHEQALLRKLRLKAGETCETPMFRSLMPGYHPWLPAAQERALLEAALYQTLGLALRVEADGLLLKSRFPGEVLVREQGAGGAWRDVWLPVKEVGDEEVEVRIESRRLEKIRRQALQPVTLQVDLVFTPLRIAPDGGRPQTAYVLLAVDASSGFIVAGELLQATEGVPAMWARIPERLLEIFEGLGGCPQVIEIGSDRMANLLRPLSELLPFKMVRREKLAMLERAQENVSAFIAREK